MLLVVDVVAVVVAVDGEVVDTAVIYVIVVVVHVVVVPIYVLVVVVVTVLIARVVAAESLLLLCLRLSLCLVIDIDRIVGMLHMALVTVIVCARLLLIGVDYVMRAPRLWGGAMTTDSSRFLCKDMAAPFRSFVVFSVYKSMRSNTPN